jgi:hypothetical protein
MTKTYHASQIKLIENREISFTYRDKQIQYVKGGSFIKIRHDECTTCNLKLDSLETNERYALNNLIAVNKDYIISVLTRFIKNLNHQNRLEAITPQTWGAIFTMDTRKCNGRPRKTREARP